MYSCKFLKCKNGSLAYKQIIQEQRTSATIVFFGGFASNMNGKKATALYNYCQNNNFNFISFDYSGHGNSHGKLTDYNISNWYENCVEVLQQLTTGPSIIVGSSMGGWLMLLVALFNKKLVYGLIGIAAAPDFTEDLIFDKMNSEQKNLLLNSGMVDFLSDDGECAYKITKSLIEDGRKHLLLRKESIDINCPVSLIHGMNDKDVPYITSIKLAEKLTSKNIDVHLIKSANHNMSDNYSLNIIFNTVKNMIKNSPNDYSLQVNN